MRLLLFVFLLVLSVQSRSLEDRLKAVNQLDDDDFPIVSIIQTLRNISLPNFIGCEQTKACFTDLLTSLGFPSSSFPSYDEYSKKMTAFESGQALQKYCGTFSAVSECFGQESNSCRTPTVFASLFDLNSDNGSDAHKFISDLDLRKIMCDNQEALADSCMNKMTAIQNPSIDADVSCDVAASDVSVFISKAADTGCPDSVQSVACQIQGKKKEIETGGKCDGKIPSCPSNFHSCDRMKECFDAFYDGVEKAGIKSPIPDYTSYAANMKKKFENPTGIDEMCRLQSSLHACLIRHINKNCPLDPASFRSMYNMDYEQAYDYVSDFELRKQQCIYKEGVKENTCLNKARPLLNMCTPDIPHNLTLGLACTDLRLAMKCNNFAVRQSCPPLAQKMYCVTQEIVYRQGALGFCDGWLPDCDEAVSPDPSSPPPDDTTDGGLIPAILQLRNITIPNFSNCEHTKACFSGLLTSIGFSSDHFPSFDEYTKKMKDSYGSGQDLKNYCGTFDAVSQCFSRESDSCRTPTVFSSLFCLSDEDAYRFTADLDLRKIMCDNQEALADPCMAKMSAVEGREGILAARDADVSCDVVATDFSAMIDKAADSGCPDSVQSVNCQINQKNKEIETLGKCDGVIPTCPSNFHSCDRMKECFDTFYAGTEAGTKTPALPDYDVFAASMKKTYENPNGIKNMCMLQSSLHACLIRHINKNCPLNAASFRSMYNMNYEQAYHYSTDFELRKQQCINIDGVMQNTCLTKAKPLLNMCTPEIPHNLTLGLACTDLRLAMKCNNFAVRQSCPVETRKMYCVTQEIVYQQGALGFCDGWLPDCDEAIYPQFDSPAEDSTDALLSKLVQQRDASFPSPGGCGEPVDSRTTVANPDNETTTKQTDAPMETTKPIEGTTTTPELPSMTTTPSAVDPQSTSEETVPPRTTTTMHFTEAPRVTTPGDTETPPVSPEHHSTDEPTTPSRRTPPTTTTTVTVEHTTVTEKTTPPSTTSPSPTTPTTSLASLPFSIAGALLLALPLMQ